MAQVVRPNRQKGAGIEPLVAIIKLLALIASTPGFRWLGGLRLDLLIYWKYCKDTDKEEESKNQGRAHRL